MDFLFYNTDDYSAALYLVKGAEDEADAQARIKAASENYGDAYNPHMWKVIVGGDMSDMSPVQPGRVHIWHVP